MDHFEFFKVIQRSKFNPLPMPSCCWKLEISLMFQLIIIPVEMFFFTFFCQKLFHWSVITVFNISRGCFFDVSDAAVFLSHNLFSFFYLKHSWFFFLVTLEFSCMCLATPHRFAVPTDVLSQLFCKRTCGERWDGTYRKAL